MFPRPHIEHQGRGRLLASLLLAGTVGVLLAVFLLVVLFAVFYLLKSVLGVDVFPGAHLWDLLAG